MATSDIITARRKNDAVIAVFQDNKKHDVTIEDLNSGAEFLTGYRKVELMGKSFSSLVPPQIKDILQSYIEYDDPMGDDLATVLKRTRQFQVVNKHGENVPISLKVFYVPGSGSATRYEILMRDVSLQEKLEAIKKQLIEEQKANNSIDPATSLPNYIALRQYITLVRDFVEKSRVEAIFALIDIETYDQTLHTKGEMAANLLVQTVGERFRKASRAEDTIGVIGNGIVGVLLFDCNTANAPLAFNRIKNKIIEAPVEIKPGLEVSVTINIAYHQVAENDTVEKVFRNCASMLDRSAQSGGNDIVQVN